MSFKVAVLKRTAIVTSAKTAVAWAGSYVDETKKNKNKPEAENGIAVGKTYFTSRPPGALTVHGYGRGRTEAISRAQGITGNDAVLEYLREHCRLQRKKGRKILGLRLILSMDPAKVTDLLHQQVDIDRLLVRVAEDTFATVASKFYPGDEFCFIMGLHHDARVDGNKGWVAYQKQMGTYKAKRPHPHIHAHVFLLPQTRDGLRISLSNRTCPGRDGVKMNPLAATLETYRENIQRQIYDFSVKKNPEIGSDWEALIRESAMSAMSDFFSAERLDDPKAALKFGLNKFVYHIRSLDREGLSKRHRARRKQFMGHTMADKDQLWNVIVRDFNELDTIFRGNIERRKKLISDVVTKFGEPIIDQPVKFWDLPSQKAFLVNPSGTKVVAARNRTAAILSAIRELGDLRRGSQMQNLAELSEMEMKLAAIQTPAKEPEWIFRLAAISKMSELPHQAVLALAAPTVTGPGIPAAAANHPRPEVPPPE